MFIVPFTYMERKCKTHTIHKINILCEGNKLWEESDGVDIKKDILHANDLVADKGEVLKDNIVYIQIDYKKTKINTMFKWEELPLADTGSILSWRSFMIINNNSGEKWIGCPEDVKLSNITLSDIIKEITYQQST